MTMMLFLMVLFLGGFSFARRWVTVWLLAISRLTSPHCRGTERRVKAVPLSAQPVPVPNIRAYWRAVTAAFLRLGKQRPKKPLSRTGLETATGGVVSPWFSYPLREPSYRRWDDKDRLRHLAQLSFGTQSTAAIGRLPETRVLRMLETRMIARCVRVGSLLTTTFQATAREGATASGPPGGASWRSGS